jgi:hypothetical protein
MEAKVSENIARGAKTDVSSCGLSMKEEGDGKN